MTFTTKTARLYGAVGGLTTAARGAGDPARATRGFLATFDRYANPEAALRAHMRRLALTRWHGPGDGRKDAPPPPGDRKEPTPLFPKRDAHGFRPLVLLSSRRVSQGPPPAA